MSSGSGVRNGAQVVWMDNVNPEYFFRDKVIEAQDRQGLRLPGNVEFYLVNLLCGFVKSREEPTEQADCLALTLKKALEGPYGQKVLLFKHIGDTALYVSGFFKDSLNRKSYDLSYYIMMGVGAFQQLAGLMRAQSTYGRAMAEIYGELSDYFHTAVEILMDVSDQTTGRADERTFDALSVYGQWLSTDSQKLSRDLLAEGIIPVPVKKGNIQ